MFFCVKDFSGTIERKILKFGTNIGYNLLYCVKRESTSSCLSFPLFVHLFFLSNKNFCHRFYGFHVRPALWGQIYGKIPAKSPRPQGPHHKRLTIMGPFRYPHRTRPNGPEKKYRTYLVLELFTYPRKILVCCYSR